ncbi:MAG: glycosyltransferase [Polyangiaceae bacterium]|nr:glycosyltransferase [Polyangiaceae bacterium]
MRVGVVVQRYGAEVNGGAELLCRTQAEHLVLRPEVNSLTVFTTCARDHETWANHYPAGVTVESGVRVERFPVLTKRLERVQNKLGSCMSSLQFGSLRLGLAFEPAWFLAQGPLSPGLLRRLVRVRQDYDVFVFYTYLYFSTVFGLPLLARKAVLIPTAHDERPIHMLSFRGLFRLPRAFGFLTPEEQEFVTRTFRVRQPHDVIGTGIGMPDETQAPAAMPAGVAAPYILYVGRVEPAKGLSELFEGFTRFKQQHADSLFRTADGAPVRGADVKLVLAGRVAWMEVPKRDDVVPLGFVSDAQKIALVRNASLFVLPSQYESLSLVILEAWAQGKPVLVNARCAATAGQVGRSGGGQTYEGPDGFAATVSRMLSDPDALCRQSRAGFAYTRDNYAWPRVEDRILRLIGKAMRRE